MEKFPKKNIHAICRVKRIERNILAIFESVQVKKGDEKGRETVTQRTEGGRRGGQRERERESGRGERRTEGEAGGVPFSSVDSFFFLAFNFFFFFLHFFVWGLGH